MTLPASGSAISFSQFQGEFGGSNPISISEYYRGTTEASPMIGRYYSPNGGTSWALIPLSGTIACSQFFSSAARRAVGHDAYDTARSNFQYTFDSSYSARIGIIAIGGGGGGGGGSSRYYGWGTVQGGTGGGGGSMYGVLLDITPSDVIYVYAGYGGAAGGARDGPYSSGSNGGSGGYSGVLNAARNAWHVLAYGGGGGEVASVNTGINVQAVGAAGGLSGIGSAISPGNVGAHGPYTTTTQGKSVVVLTQGGGTGGAGVYFGPFGRPGGGPTWGTFGSNLTHSNPNANSPGYGTFNWHGLAGQLAGPAASGYTNSYYGIGGGGGGGGINVADNNLAMSGAAGQPGALVIFW